MKSKLTAFFAVLLMIVSASAGMMLISDTDSPNLNLPGGGVQEFNDLSSLSSDNNNNFILSNDQSNSPDNSVDINSVEVNKTGNLVDSDTREEVSTDIFISIKDKEGLIKLSTLVNDGFGFADYIVILTTDLTLGDPAEGEQSNFTPIGDANNKFKGTFDGQGIQFLI